jgi:hypothetical protein
MEIAVTFRSVTTNARRKQVKNNVAAVSSISCTIVAVYCCILAATYAVMRSFCLKITNAVALVLASNAS